MGKPEGKVMLRRLCSRRKYTIKLDFKINRMGVDWLHLAKVRGQRRAFVNTEMDFRLLIKRWEIL